MSVLHLLNLPHQVYSFAARYVGLAVAPETIHSAFEALPLARYEDLAAN